MPRPPKKSETLEIRLPYSAKQAFMARCRDEGRSASEAMRGFIEREIEAPGRPSRARHWIAGALLAVAAGAVALPSLAHPGADLQRLDLNHDGAVSLAEFQRLDSNHDGVVTPAELRGR